MAAYKSSQEQIGVQLNQEMIADLYNRKVRVSSGEQVSKYFVGQALRIFQHIFSDEDCRKLVLEVGHLMEITLCRKLVCYH